MQPSTSTPDVKALAAAVAGKVLPFKVHNYFLEPSYNYKPYGWDESKWNALRLVREQLNMEGFQFLGNGAFSVAYTHVDFPDRVLKINLKPDAASVQWWQHCLDHPGEGIPEVYATGKLGQGDNQVPFVWMKRYTKGDEQERSALCALYGCEGDVPDYIVRVMDVAEQYGRPDLHEGNIMWCEDTQRWVIIDPVYE